jgi:hypothetical protein
MDDTSVTSQGQHPVIITASQLGQLADLCNFMQLLRAWWDHFEAVIRQLDKTAAAKAYDIMIDGVIAARQLARDLGFDMADPASFNWSASIRVEQPAFE